MEESSFWPGAPLGSCPIVFWISKFQQPNEHWLGGVGNGLFGSMEALAGGLVERANGMGALALVVGPVVAIAAWGGARFDI